MQKKNSQEDEKCTLTENAQPLLLLELLFDAAGLQADPSIGKEVCMAHGEGQPEHSAVGVNYVDKGSVGWTKAQVLGLERVEGQGGIQTWERNAKVVS